MKHEEIPRKTRIDLFLVRIIANASTGSSLGPVRIYGIYQSYRNDSNKINYSRLLLCKVVGESENQTLVYMMESRNTNKNLWNKNTQLRDDG